MSCTFTIDPERRLVSVRMWANLTRTEILAVAARISADPLLGKGFSELIDLREVTSSADISPDDVRALASVSLDPVARRAFLVSENSTFGLARMFEAYRGLEQAKEDVGVFRTIESAEAWLAETP